MIVVVPNDPLKAQWITECQLWSLQCDVKTSYDVSKNKYDCDLLVIDEAHKIVAPTLVKVFENVKYKRILGLTATFERLDGRHAILEKYCPRIAEVTMDEALKNNWLSKYKEYLVLIEPEDIEEYNNINKTFNQAFSFFGFNFTTAIECATSWQRRAALAKEMCHGGDFKAINKQILANAMTFSRTLQARKKYINNHPRKIELANLILEHRKDKKCITFSNTIAMAEKIKYGKVYSGKDSKKKGRLTLDEFLNGNERIINTVMKLNEGFNDPELSVSILLGINSSKAQNKQRLGRVIRTNGSDKEAEVFYLILKGTVEETWFKNAVDNDRYITIGEDNLINVLERREFTQKKNKQTAMLLRW